MYGIIKPHYEIYFPQLSHYTSLNVSSNFTFYCKCFKKSRRVIHNNRAPASVNVFAQEIYFLPFYFYQFPRLIDIRLSSFKPIDKIWQFSVVIKHLTHFNTARCK